MHAAFDCHLFSNYGKCILSSCHHHAIMVRFWYIVQEYEDGKADVRSLVARKTFWGSGSGTAVVVAHATKGDKSWVMILEMTCSCRDVYESIPTLRYHFEDMYLIHGLWMTSAWFLNYEDMNIWICPVKSSGSDLFHESASFAPSSAF